MPDRLLNLWNAITDYEAMYRKKQQRENLVIFLSLVIVIIVCIGIMVYECCILKTMGVFG